MTLVQRNALVVNGYSLRLTYIAEDGLSVRTRIRIPNLIGTLYRTETVHIAQIWTQIPTPYFCRGQESESLPKSVSCNVNEPLQMSSF